MAECEIKTYLENSLLFYMEKYADIMPNSYQTLADKLCMRNDISI